MRKPNQGVQVPATVTLTEPPSTARAARMLEAKRVAEMVNALPSLMRDESLHPLARQACVETFFTHVRALIEFLEIKPTNNTSDYSAKSIVPEWEPTLDDPMRSRLVGYWTDASRHVVHFTKARAIRWNDATEELLEDITVPLFAIWDQYANAVGPHLFAPKRENFMTLDEMNND